MNLVELESMVVQGHGSDQLPGAYAIFNITTKKVYIGVRFRGKIRDRWKEHLKCLLHGNHHNILLQRAWDKYGGDDFGFMVVENCSEDECLVTEQFYIEFFQSTDREHGYNICKFGTNRTGTTHSEESRAKISAANRSRSPESRKKHAAKLRGRKQSEESNKKRSEGLRKAYVEGRRNKVDYTPELRKRLGDGRRGKRMSKESRAKISEGLTGRPCSAETRAKIGAANKISLKGLRTGYKHTEESRKKMSESRKGRTFSEESRAKMSVAKKGKPWTQARRDAQCRR